MSPSAQAPQQIPPKGEVTRLLDEIRNGNHGSAEQLVPLIYDELRRLARRQLRSERNDHTLQTTALVHEAYLKLTSGAANDFTNRSHFFLVAAQVMRQILVDSARSRLAKKRGGGSLKIALTEALPATEEGLENALIVSEALSKLEKLDPRQVRIVEMKFYVGLDLEEIASALGITKRTVSREWRSAQAWLYAELGS